MCKHLHAKMMSINSNLMLGYWVLASVMDFEVKEIGLPYCNKWAPRPCLLASAGMVIGNLSVVLQGGAVGDIYYRFKLLE